MRSKAIVAAAGCETRAGEILDVAARAATFEHCSHIDNSFRTFMRRCGG